MRKLCLTAGTRLSDVIWAANVLPHLRKALPETTLAWECPIPGIQAWLRLYRELDEVFGDVETVQPPPDEYRIIHPFWCPPKANVSSPVKAMFSLVESWSPAPTEWPKLPYVPALIEGGSSRSDIPENYICFEPVNEGYRPLDEAVQKIWVTFISYLAIPGVQLGSMETPLLHGMIDARGSDALESARLILRSRLFISGDTDLSCLASTLGVPQIWLLLKNTGWWWPRVDSSYQRVYPLDFSAVNLEDLLGLIWEISFSGGVAS